MNVVLSFCFSIHLKDFRVLSELWNPLEACPVLHICLLSLHHGYTIKDTILFDGLNVRDNSRLKGNKNGLFLS